MDGAWANDTPGLGLEVQLLLAVAVALGLALAATLNDVEQGVNITTKTKLMGRNWTDPSTSQSKTAVPEFAVNDTPHLQKKHV